MAQRIVDLFHVVKIGEEQQQALFISFRHFNLLFRQGQESSPVVDAGELIRDGHDPDIFFVPFFFRYLHGVSKNSGPSFIVNGRHGLHDPADFSLFGHDPEFIGGDSIAGEHFPGVVFHFFSVFRVNDGIRFFSNQFLRIVTGIGSALEIDILERAVLNHVNAGKRSFRQGFVEFPGLLSDGHITNNTSKSCLLARRVFHQRPRNLQDLPGSVFSHANIV